MLLTSLASVPPVVVTYAKVGYAITRTIHVCKRKTRLVDDHSRLRDL